MRAHALTLLGYVALWSGVSVCVALTWSVVAWGVGRYAKADVMHVSKRGLYDPRNPGDGCG